MNTVDSSPIVSDASQKKILILDPSPMFSRTLKEVVQTSHPDVTVTETQDIDHARTILKKKPPQVVFLDIAFPRTNGMRLISQIREMAPNACIVVLSSHAWTGYKEASMQKGANYFLSKERSGGLRLLDVIHEAILGDGDGRDVGVTHWAEKE